MRPLVLSLLLAFAPARAAAEPRPRSLGLEIGFARDSAAVAGDRTPVALLATWWLAGELDATARASWSFAARTDGRAADGVLEAGAGLRYGLAAWPVLRPLLEVNVAFVRLAGLPAATLAASGCGARIGAGAGLEASLARDLSLALAVEASELLLPDGGGPGLGLALRVAAYF